VKVGWVEPSFPGYVFSGSLLSLARRWRSGTSGRESGPWESREVLVLAEDEEDEDDEDSEEVAVSDEVVDASTQEEVEGSVKSALEVVAGASKSADSKSSSLGGGNLMSVV
jgi:hypothetical protein